MSNLTKINLQTNKRNQFINISASVTKVIKESGISSGICLIHIPHTTAGVTINENADPAVPVDMTGFLNKLIPKDPAFTHAEGNSDSHIKTTLTGPSLSIIIENNKPILGVWQGIYFCEYDGPRNRHYFIKCIRD